MTGHSIPIPRSFSETKAKEFYTDFLGFDVVFEHKRPLFIPLYLGITSDNCMLHISEHHRDACPDPAL